MSDKKEMSSYEAKLAGEIRNEIEKATNEIFKQLASSTNILSRVKDGTRFTVRLKSGDTEKTLVNYETPDVSLGTFFRELNTLIPAKWQLRNP